MTPASLAEPDDFGVMEELLSHYRPTAMVDASRREQLARRAVSTRWYNQIESLAAAFLLGVTLLTIAVAAGGSSAAPEKRALSQPIALPPLEPGFTPDESQLAALRFAAGTQVKPIPELRGDASLPSLNLWGVTP